MAEELDWPLLEDQIVDHLTSATGFAWRVTRDGEDLPAKAGGVRVSMSGESDVDRSYDVELTVVAATRSGMWQLTGKTDRVMRKLDFLSRSYVDEVVTVFGWTPEDPGPTGLASGTATYRLTVRRQPEPMIDQVL